MNVSLLHGEFFYILGLVYKKFIISFCMCSSIKKENMIVGKDFIMLG